jgi:carboxylesterase type B
MSAPGIEVPTSADSRTTAVALLNSLGCDSNNNPLACLRARPVSDIVEQSLLLPDPENFLHLLFRFAVYIDGLEIRSSFFDSSNFNFGKKPTLIGTSAFEALSFAFAVLRQPVPLPAYGAVVGQWRPAIVQDTQRLYVSSPSSTADVRPEISELVTDAVFTCPARFFANRIALESNVWVYVFNHPNLASFQNPLSCDDRACHVDDFPYFFRHPEFVTGVQDNFFSQLSDLITGYFGNFVKKGNPNSCRMRPVWLRHYSRQTFATIRKKSKWQFPLCYNLTLELRSPDPRMIQNFRQDRCDYWDSVGYERE